MLGIDDLIRIEDAADAGTIGNADLLPWPEIEPLLAAFNSQRWDAVENEAEKLWACANSIHEQVFIIQWAAAGAELQYNLGRRAKWVEAWAQVPGWAQNWYSRYLRVYQQAMACYFDNKLRDAEAGFQSALSITKAQGYLRGQMRSLFHLGLVHRNRHEPEKARQFFLLALEIATVRRSRQYADRILAQLDRKTADGFRFDVQKKKVRKLILSGDFANARRMLAQAESERRRQKLHRHREGLIYLAAAIAAGQKRENAAKRLFGLISDPVLKISVLEMKIQLNIASFDELAELDVLKEMHGIDRVVVISCPGVTSEIEVCGVALSSLRDQDVVKLMRLLIEAPNPLDKEQIFRGIWNMNYDPVIHNSKIYKVIYNARKLFGRRDLFVNTYGAYRISPKYLRSCAAVMKSA